MIKRLLLIIGALLLMAGGSYAQNCVQVTGQVMDINGSLYSGGSGVFTLVPQNVQWTTGGTNPVKSPLTIAQLDSFGRFSICITPVNAIDQQASNPQWQISFSSAQYTNPTTKYSFTMLPLALSNAQDITAIITPQAAILPISGGGGNCSLGIGQVAFGKAGGICGGDPSFTFDSINKILGIANVDNFVFVDPAGSTNRTLSAALANCAAGTGCVVFDAYPETNMSSNPFASMPTTTSCTVNLGAGLWTTNVEWIMQPSQWPCVLHGSGRSSGTGGTFSPGTTLQASSTFSPGTPLLYNKGGQGSRVENMTLDGNGLASVGAYATDINEQGGFLNLLILNVTSACVRVNAPGLVSQPAQNYILQDIECFPQLAGVSGATVGYDIIGDGGGPGRALDLIALGQSGHTLLDALRINNNSVGTHYIGIHGENTTNVVELGSGSNTLDTISGNPGVTNIVLVDNTGIIDYSLVNILNSGATHTIADPVNGNTINDFTCPYYTVGQPSGGNLPISTICGNVTNTFTSAVNIQGYPLSASYYFASGTPDTQPSAGLYRLTRHSVITWENEAQTGNVSISKLTNDDLFSPGIETNKLVVPFASGFSLTLPQGGSFTSGDCLEAILSGSAFTFGDAGMPCGSGGGGSVTLATSGVNNAVQTLLNFIPSNSTPVGLTATPVNPATTGNEAFNLTGTLTPNGGGTGVANPTAHTLPIAEGASNYNYLTMGVDTILQGQGSGADPVALALTNCVGANAYSTSTHNYVCNALPGNTPAVTHQFFTAYNSGTGVFAQAQPAFTDLTGTGNVVLNNQANTYSTGLQDFSAVTLKIPASATFTSSSTSTLGIATTAGNLHAFLLADSVIPSANTPGSWVNGDCAEIFVSSGQLAIADAGGACATGSTTAWANLTSGTNTHTGTFAATGQTWDFTGVTLFKLRVGSTLTTTANGDIGYDTTNKMWHGYQNGADSFFFQGLISGTFTNNDCPKISVASSQITLVDSGAGCGGGGTVTSFSAGNGSPFFTTAVSTATTTPALSFSISVQSANCVFAGPASGGATTPTCRALVSADIPNNAANTSGNAATATLAATATAAAGTPTLCSTGQAPTGVNASWNAVGCAALLVNPLTLLGDVPYGGASGALTRLAGPTGPNGVPQFLIDIPAAGAAVAETFANAGVVPNPQTGTSYTVLATDRAGHVTLSNASAIAVTLPAAGGSGFASNYLTGMCDIGAGTATITPTTSTISYTNGSAYTSGASTMTLTTGQCATIYSDNTNYFATKYTGGTATGNTTSTSLTTTHLPKANGANSIIDSSVTDDGTTVSTAENFAFGGTGTDLDFTTLTANQNINIFSGNGTYGSAGTGYVALAGVPGSILTKVLSTGTVVAPAYTTLTNCSSSASPAVCGSAAAGSVAIPTGTGSSTLVVNTSAVTANSQIMLQADDTLGTKLSVTCNSTLSTLVGGSAVTARTAGTSFTITFNGSILTNPVCVSYTITN